MLGDSAEFRSGQTVVPGSLVRETQIQARLGQIGFKFEHALELGDGRVEAARLHIGLTGPKVLPELIVARWRLGGHRRVDLQRQDNGQSQRSAVPHLSNLTISRKQRTGD